MHNEVDILLVKQMENLVSLHSNWKVPTTISSEIADIFISFITNEEVACVAVAPGGGEAGAGCRDRLPQREGEAGAPELHPDPESHPPLHL